jgi:hypothetical protein
MKAKIFPDKIFLWTVSYVTAYINDKKGTGNGKDEYRDPSLRSG